MNKERKKQNIQCHYHIKINTKMTMYCISNNAIFINFNCILTLYYKYHVIFIYFY